MAKLQVLSGKNVCMILEKHGFVEVRRRGSHIVMQKKSSEGNYYDSSSGSYRASYRYTTINYPAIRSIENRV